MLSGTVKRKQNENYWFETKILRYMFVAFGGAFAYMYFFRQENSN